MKFLSSFRFFSNLASFFVYSSIAVALLFALETFIPPRLLKGDNIIVAITQIIPHPSLDKIRQGIEEVLREQNFEVSIIYENAQGNIALATQIAQKFVSLRPNAIVAITTPSAQATYAAAKPYHIPVIFGAVSDPVAAKLVPSLSMAGEGITGTSDMPPIVEQVKLIVDCLSATTPASTAFPSPPLMNKVGVIYNPGEANSVALVQCFRLEIEKHGFTLVLSPAPNTTDVTAAAQSLVGRVDAIYIPNDNTAVSALDAIINIANKNKIPVFAADPESVIRGCVASIAYNQLEIGRQTGKMVAKILGGQPLHTLPVEQPRKAELSINLRAAAELGLSLPSIIRQKADHVIGGEE